MKEHKDLAPCTKGTKYLTNKLKDNSISSIVLHFDEEKIEDRLKVIFKQINKKSSMKALL